MQPHVHDLAVVGLGAMGSAVLFHAARQGLSVVGIDRFEPPHTMGSTHAETRISRLAVGEGTQYLPFVARSHELWRELEELSGEQLLYSCGGLIVTEREQEGARWHDFVSETDHIATTAGLDFEVMSPASVSLTYPALTIPSQCRVGFEPTAGLVMNERAVTVQLDQAERLGASVRCNEQVLVVDPSADTVRVVTDQGDVVARKVVLATGPWLSELAHPVQKDRLSVTRQVVYWFEAEELDAFSTDKHPFVMWVGRTDEDYFALFPRPPGTTKAVKVMGEQFLETTTPDEVDRSVSPDGAAAFHDRFIAPRVEGISSRLARAEVCLYTNTPDDHFLIDTDPRSERITVMSPCSGHGFKHSAALGEAVVQQITTGTSDLDLDPFRLR